MCKQITVLMIAINEDIIKIRSKCAIPLYIVVTWATTGIAGFFFDEYVIARPTTAFSCDFCPVVVLLSSSASPCTIADGRPCTPFTRNYKDIRYMRPYSHHIRLLYINNDIDSTCYVCLIIPGVQFLMKLQSSCKWGHSVPLHIGSISICRDLNWIALPHVGHSTFQPDTTQSCRSSVIKR